MYINNAIGMCVKRRESKAGVSAFAIFIRPNMNVKPHLYDTHTHTCVSAELKTNNIHLTVTLMVNSRLFYICPSQSEVPHDPHTEHGTTV